MYLGVKNIKGNDLKITGTGKIKSHDWFRFDEGQPINLDS